MKKVVLTAAVLIAGVSFANAQTAKAEKISKAKAEVATKAAVKAEAKSDTRPLRSSLAWRNASATDRPSMSKGVTKQRSRASCCMESASR